MTPQTGAADSSAPPGPLRGEVAYLFAYDLSYDMKRAAIERLLGKPLEQFTAGASRPSPRSFGFYRPRMVTLPPKQAIAATGQVELRRTIKLFPVSAISIAFRVDFEVERLDELMGWHELMCDGGPIEHAARALAADVLRDLSPHLVRPVESPEDAESYTIFCFNRGCVPGAPGREQCPTALAWVEAHRRDMARLLTQETGRARLSEYEVRQATQVQLSYYEHDAVVIDWDAAVMVDEPENFDELLHVMELANVQLAELAAYDRLLDHALERSYRDVAQPRRGGAQRAFVRQLRDLRIDLARFSDELSNITKFFGDWYLARLYQAVAGKFHLADWDRTVDQKLQMLDSFYQLLKQDRMNRYMIGLEVAIVVLFIVDLLALFLSAH